MEATKTTADEVSEYAESIINTIREPLIILDHDLRVVSASRSFYTVFKVKPEETVGQLIYDLGNKQWDIPKLRELLETILPQNTTFDDYEVEHDFADIGKRIMLLNARQIQRVLGKERIILLAIEDITERRHLETLLEDSEERYRRLFETANDGILLLEKRKGDIVHANPAVTAMLGYANDEFIGNDLKSIGLPDDIGTFHEILQTLNKDGIIHYKDIPVKKKTGQVIETDIYMVDKASLVQCNIRDVTERKHAEEAARAFLDSVINTIADPVFVKDDKRRFVLVNKALCAIVGRRRESLLGEDGDDMFPKEEVAVFRKMDANVLDTGEENVNEESLSNLSTGEVRTIITRKTRYIDPAGNRFLVGVIRDITEHKRWEESLVESEDRYKSLIDNVSDIIFTIDLEGKIIFMSRKIKEILGYESAEMINMNILNFIPEEDHQRAMESLQKGMKGEKIIHFQIPIIKKSGELCFFECSFSRVYKDGAVVGAQGTAVNISERKKAEAEKVKLEAQLQQAQKMEAIGTLAGGIAHDFNNILTAIMGYTELAFFTVPQDTSAREDLEEALKASHRAKDLIKQILAFSRHSENLLLEVQIHVIIKEALKLLRSSLPTTIEIKQNINALGKVLADPTQIHQIMMNLCTNAAHAMSENGGELAVSLIQVNFPDDESAPMDLPPGPYLKLTVSDTGCGMTPDVLDRIFDPYFTTKEKEKGTGLGLAVVHGIVRSHGGLITVESTPGKGSSFHVYLPQTRDLVQAQETIKVEEPLLTGAERILFVDDEPIIVKMGQKMLEKLGYEVVVRTSSVEALELFKANPDQFDLVITDMTMPHMRGDQLSGKLLEIRPDIPIILCSGFSDKISEDLAKELGIREFVMKPISMQILAQTVRKVLDESKKS